MTNPQPYWHMTPYIDGAGQQREQWQPSEEMTYLLGCLLSTKDKIDVATFAEPTLILLPTDRVPIEARTGGTLYGIPFAVSDKVTTPSLVYPASQGLLHFDPVQPPTTPPNPEIPQTSS